MRNRLPVLRRSGLRPWHRGARSRRGSPLAPLVNDLRARIAQIVERDRAQRIDKHGETGHADQTSGTDRNPLYAAEAALGLPTETLSTRQGPPGLTAGAPSRGGPRSAPLAELGPRFEVRER